MHLDDPCSLFMIMSFEYDINLFHIYLLTLKSAVGRSNGRRDVQKIPLPLQGPLLQSRRLTELWPWAHTRQLLKLHGCLHIALRDLADLGFSLPGRVCLFLLLHLLPSLNFLLFRPLGLLRLDDGGCGATAPLSNHCSILHLKPGLLEAFLVFCTDMCQLLQIIWNK